MSQQLNESPEPDYEDNNDPDALQPDERSSSGSRRRAPPVVTFSRPASSTSHNNNDRQKTPTPQPTSSVPSPRASQHSTEKPLESVDASLYVQSQKDLEKLQWSLNHQLRDINDMRNALAERDLTIDEMASRIRSLEVQLTEKQRSMAALEEQVTVLKEQEWLAQRTTAKIESEVATSRGYAVKVRELLDDTSRLRETIKRNADELESTRRRANHYRLVIEAMEKQLREIRAENAEMHTLQDEVRTLKALGIVKEKENLQCKNALHMLEAWFIDYDKMDKSDFQEIRRRAIDGVSYPEGVEGDKYDQFFHRERIKKDEEVVPKKSQHIPGMHRRKNQDNDNDSDAGSGTKRSGSQAGGALAGQSYLDLGTIPADSNFNLIEHIRDLVSVEDNFLLDQIKVGLRVQIRLDRVVIPTGSGTGPVSDSWEVVTARHMPTSNSATVIANRRPKTRPPHTARADLSGVTSSTVSVLDLSKVVSEVVADRNARKQQQAITYSGLVRYIGLLDMPSPTTTVYAGVKLDDRVGYTNGTLLGKRYFFAPEGHGIFIRLADITALLNTKNYEYVSISRMFRKWRKTSQKKM